MTRSATDAEIKAAYRKESKKRHPDKGGSPEDFSRLVSAKALLLDPKRRAKYDATGEVDSGVDNEFAEIINCAMAAIDKVLRWCESQRQDPREVNIISRAQNFIDGDLGQLRGQLDSLKAGVGQIISLISRFKAKKGKRNFLKPMFEARKADLERRIVNQEHQIKQFEAARQLLQDHEFNFDKRVADVYEQRLARIMNVNPFSFIPNIV